MATDDERVVIRDSGFRSSLDHLMRGDWAKGDAYLRAAEILLAADPTIGTEVGQGIWILPMAPVDDRDVWLHYTFYESVVVLLELDIY